MRFRRTIPVAAAFAGVVLAATAGPALAAPSPGATAPSTTAGHCSSTALGFVQARVNLAVQQRESTITALTAALAARTHVTPGHRSTLSSLYTSDAAGLTAVNATVHSDMTCAEAITDGRTVVTSFRVYMLLVPQTHLVAASDSGTWAAGQITAAEGKAQAAVNQLTDPAKKAAAQAELADMTSAASTATSDFTGVGDGVLAMTPPQIPAQESTLDGYRSQVAAGRAALAQAIADARALRQLLA
jgi:hypothetical protein